MSPARRVPPAWVLSIPVATFGMVAGFIIVTLPQILAAQNVPGGQIAVAVAVITSPGFWIFLVAPILDVRFRRRTYALGFGLLAVFGTAFTVFYHPAKVEIEAVMIVAFMSLALYGAAVGGWTGALIEKEQTGKLGAWNTIFNICSGGLGVLISGFIIQHFSPGLGALLVLIIFLAPMLAFFFIPAPEIDNTLASESFRRFHRDVISLFKRREVLVALAMFILPSASFALTNTLGGWGKEFQASPGLVSFFGGVGSIVAGVIGSFLIPPIAKKLPLRPMYLAIGIIGACFTLSLLLLPRTSATFGLAFFGENLFQAAAFATSFAIVYDVIGKGNPLAATIFAVLTNALNFPIFYMEIVDGHGFDWNGVAGAFIVDAIVSGGVCILLWIVLFKILRVQNMHPSTKHNNSIANTK
jgi:MFS transporter, PAT family, beta-lactamase induction signal transducer AmpG